LVSTCLRNASESIDVNEQNGQSVNRVAAVSILFVFPFCSMVLLIELPRDINRFD
jgi:hypothetical protein